MPLITAIAVTAFFGQACTGEVRFSSLDVHETSTLVLRLKRIDFAEIRRLEVAIQKTKRRDQALFSFDEVPTVLEVKGINGPHFSIGYSINPPVCVVRRQIDGDLPLTLDKDLLDELSRFRLATYHNSNVLLDNLGDTPAADLLLIQYLSRLASLGIIRFTGSQQKQLEQRLTSDETALEINCLLIQTSGKDCITDFAARFEGANSERQKRVLRLLANSGRRAECVLPLLRKTLMQDEGELRDLALIAISEIGPNAECAIDDIVGVLEKSLDPHLRARALSAISSIYTKANFDKSVDAFLTGLSDKNHFARARAAFCVRRLDYLPATIAGRLEAICGDDDCATAGANAAASLLIRNPKHPIANRWIAREMSHDDELRRARAIKVAEELPEITPELFSLLVDRQMHDESEERRHQAGDAVAKHRNKATPK